MSDFQVLAEHQRGMFLRGTQDVEVYNDPSGYPCIMIDEKEIPLYNQDTPVSIVQPGSVQQNRELAPHKGKFHINFGGEDSEFVEELWLLPITVINRGFVKFAGDYNSQQTPQRLCWSNNGLVHEPDVPMPCSPKCAVLNMRDGVPTLKKVCPEAMYVEGQRSSCREFINVAFFDLKREVPVRFRLHGTAISSWYELSKDYTRTINNARRKRLNVGDYVIHATLEDNGTYYKPVFQFVYAPEDIQTPSKYQPILHWYLTALYSNTNNPDATQASVDAETGEVFDVPSTDSTISEIEF